MTDDIPDLDEINERTEELSDDMDESMALDTAVGEQFDSDDSDSIGHVAASQGLHIGIEENFVHAYIWTSQRESIRVGDYVSVPYSNESGNTSQLFAAVKSLDYLTEGAAVPDLDDLSGQSDTQTFNEDRYPLIAALDPITILRPSDGGDLPDRGAVDAIPKPFTHVAPVTDQDTLSRGLNLPPNGAAVGHVAVSGQPVPRSSSTPLVYNLLDPEPGSPRDPAIFRHVMVAGSTGKGKTQFSKNVLRQFAGGAGAPEYAIEDQNGNPKVTEPGIVIIDPENEYSEMAKDPADVDQETLDEFESQGFSVGGVDDCTAFVPSVEYAGDITTDADQTMEFSIPFSIVRGRPALLMPFSAEAPTRQAISRVIRDFFQRHGQDATYSQFINWVKDPALKEEYTESGRIHEGSWDAMMSRIDIPAFHNVFDNGAQSLTDIDHEMFTEGRVSVIPTDHITGREERIVVMSILAYVVENKLSTHNPQEAVKHTPLILCVDEAHNFLASRANAQDEYIIKKFVEAAKQGRKYKLGLYMVTQNPVDIDEEIRHQTNTKAFLGLEQATVRKVEVPPAFEDKVPLFGPGQAVIKAPDVQPVELQAPRIPFTLHDS